MPTQFGEQINQSRTANADRFGIADGAAFEVCPSGTVRYYRDRFDGAITAWHPGGQPARDISGGDWLAPHLARLLEDPYGVVRHIAKESLEKQPGFGEFEYDFLADAPKRTRLAKRAIAQWNEQPGETSGEAILI